ncbi:helix-turn-helix transcriptional regulator [Antrihabitans stalactiti]|uniref:ArsR family transcriptional regulator n=1 Tax=Antrihabitans stalactiti TaxID=2584121 RepID=A0A848KQ83_9NOCA|nr:helix-turn-helix domain-containing protein [Antrihabitans stalactiti]NMN99084.1 ArsR family transcriptional regulator [Antrihabitans stalactiti]
MAIRKGTVAERASTHAVLASGRRVRLLDVLRVSPTPMTISELAAVCDLHVTTVRFHLDALTTAGLVSAEPEPNPARGRPRQLYRAPAPLEPDHRADSGYERLAGVLATHWASAGDDDPAHRAEAAGRAWGLEDFTDTPVSPRSVEEAANTITTLFAEMGFDPALESTPEELRIRLHACPFEPVARESPNVVCAVHLGLLRGVLARLHAPETDIRLIPWETPHTCVAHLARHTSDPLARAPRA